MPYFPTIPETNVTQQVTDVFRGYNHNMKIGDGEFFEMENLTSDYYPLLANRRKRGVDAAVHSPDVLLGKEKLAYISRNRLYYGEEDLTEYFREKLCAISENEAMQPKRLFSMGAYIIVLPDKLYINTRDYSDCGCIEAHFSTSAVSYRMCMVDGTEYDAPTLSETQPENPKNGALWIDPYGEVRTLNRYNSSTDTWDAIPTVYTKLSAPGIGASFKVYDGVEIRGCRVSGEVGNHHQIEALNGSKILYAVGTDYIVVVGLLDEACTQSGGEVTVSRVMPEMDFITEAENRLWGCKYGYTENGPVNEIYCCALGDFKNWEQYLGLSTDSWRGSLGTDGPFTGAITHNGYPLFFKENCLHKVYISSSGAHRITETQCRGVQYGSHKSLAIVNETLFYKGVSEVLAYDGTMPVSVSEALGNKRYFNAVAGAYGDKYYISMMGNNPLDGAGEWDLFVFDTVKGLWHREDNLHVLQFENLNGHENINGHLYFLLDGSTTLCADSDRLIEFEKAVSWSAVTGLMGYGTVERKYISRLNLRMQLPVGSTADLYIEYDSDGVWHHAGHMVGTGTKTFMLPVRPRRCDHFRIKLTGVGDVRVYSFAKIFEAGSDM